MWSISSSQWQSECSTIVVETAPPAGRFMTAVRQVKKNCGTDPGIEPRDRDTTPTGDEYSSYFGSCRAKLVALKVNAIINIKHYV